MLARFRGLGRWKATVALLIVVAFFPILGAISHASPASALDALTAPTVPTVVSVDHFSFDAPTWTSPANLSVSAGDLVLVFVAAHYRTTVLTVEDSSENPYTSLMSVESGTQVTLSGWAATASVAASDLAITVTLSRLAPCVFTEVVVAGAGSSPIDAQGPSASGTSETVGASITTVQAPDLVLLGFASTGLPTVTAESGFTLTSYLTETKGQTHTMGAVLDALVASPGSISVSAHLSTSETWAAEAVAIAPLVAPSKGTYLVSGSIMNLWGTVVDGATVTADEHGINVSTTTNSTGSYSISLSNGTYSLIGTAPGYANGSRSIKVDGVPLANRNLTLSPLPAPPPAGDGSIQHVVVIMFENQPLSSVLRQGPYERYLADTYGSVSDFYSVCHPSIPNYLAVTSGLPYQCGTDAYNVYSTTNVGDLLEARNLTWAGYFENMPGPCGIPNNGTYVVHHNPFLYYADVVDEPGRCDAHVLPATAWAPQVSSGTLLNYSLYIPNTRDDGENTSVRFADVWLKKFLSPLLNSTSPPLEQTIAHTAFFLLYDESDDSDTSGYNGTDGGHVYCVVVSPYTRGVTLVTNATDYNLLTTTEWLLGLASTGHFDGTSEFPALEALFDFEL